MREGDYPIVSPSELAETGRALYGPHWRVELAHALGLPDETLIALVEGGFEPAPPEWRAKLIAIAQDTALRAMDAASALLWSERAAPVEDRVTAPPPASVRHFV